MSLSIHGIRVHGHFREELMEEAQQTRIASAKRLLKE